MADSKFFSKNQLKYCDDEELIFNTKPILFSYNSFSQYHQATDCLMQVKTIKNYITTLRQ
jgi:hypothetical protein